MSITIMIVEDEENARKAISDFLTAKKYDPIPCENLSKAREALKTYPVDIVLLDVFLPDGNGTELLYDIAQMPYRPPCILLTASDDIQVAVDAMRNGALDFISKPFEFSRLELALQKAEEIVSLRREVAEYRRARQEDLKFVLGSSSEFNRVISEAQRTSKASINVLITGESGSGKEVVAKYIHTRGPRSGKPFIPVNCAAIQSTIFESELFGHERGAFSNAIEKKPGLMEQADTGVLFLDEISSMPLDIQGKLLRALEDKSFYRVGGIKLIRVDVQILAASNRDLKAMVDKGEFRQDLYYRLNVVEIKVPNLRDRKEDIPELTGFFIRKFNMEMGKNIMDISPLALEALKAYSWPGNIRELSNAVERAMLFCDEPVLDLGHLPDFVFKTDPTPA